MVDLIRINDVIDAGKYRQIVCHAIPPGRLTSGPKFSLQQDNNTLAKVIMNYLQCKREQEVLEVMACPPQSSVVSIVECVWGYTNTQKDLRKICGSFSAQLSSFNTREQEYLKEPMLP